MSHQTYVFTAELVGFAGVRRTVTVRNDLTLVDLHYALQSAFGWDDELRESGRRLRGDGGRGRDRCHGDREPDRALRTGR